MQTTIEKIVSSDKLLISVRGCQYHQLNIIFAFYILKKKKVFTIYRSFNWTYLKLVFTLKLHQKIQITSTITHDFYSLSEVTVSVIFDEYTHTRHRSTIESDTRGTIQDFFLDTSSIFSQRN